MVSSNLDASNKGKVTMWLKASFDDRLKELLVRVSYLQYIIN